jgi:hypothetical protein
MINNTHMSQFVPPSMIAKTAGTWTPTLTSNVMTDVRTAADANFTLMAPVALPQSANLKNGARLKSIDVYYKITTAADDFATVELEKMTLLASQAIPTGAALAVTLDSSHDTAAKRKAAGDHVMTVTLTAPLWMTQADAVVLVMIVDAAAATVFTLYGVRANFDLRID